MESFLSPEKVLFFELNCIHVLHVIDIVTEPYCSPIAYGPILRTNSIMSSSHAFE